MPDNTNVRFAIHGSIGQIVIGDIACEEDLGRLQAAAIRLRAALTNRGCSYDSCSEVLEGLLGSGVLIGRRLQIAPFP